MRKELKIAVDCLKEKIDALETLEASHKKQGWKLLAEATKKKSIPYELAWWKLSEILESWPHDSPH